ncbi:hypothetical protein G6Y30_06235 [Staphylococcus aureus]|nr:hypothetical protein [Staphylococcus aureus]
MQARLTPLYSSASSDGYKRQVMLTAMYFVPFGYHKIPIFAGMAIIFTVYFSNKKSIDETNIFSKKNRNKNKQ